MITNKSWNFRVCFLLMALSVGCKKSNLPNKHAGNKQSSPVLRVPINSEPPTLDWNLAHDTISTDIIHNLMRGLFVFGDGTEPVMDLAEKYTLSPDRRTYTFWLKKNIHWSDGVSLNAQQFKDSFLRVLDPQTGSQWADYLFVINKGRSFYEGKSKGTEVGIKVLSDLEFQIELEKPFAYFLHYLAMAHTFPIRLDIIKKFISWSEPGRMVTLGAYFLDSWAHEYKLILKANPDVKPQPYFSSVDILILENNITQENLFQNGELDIIPSVPLEDIGKYKNKSGFYLKGLEGTYYLALSLKKAPFDKLEVRKAFAQSLDRNEITKIFDQNIVSANSLVLPFFPEYAGSQILEFDPLAAQRLLKASGVDFKKTSPVFAYNSNFTNKLIVESLQNQWKKNLGIQVELKGMDWKSYLQMINVDPPDIHRMILISPVLVHDYLQSFVTGNKFNRIRYNNPKYDLLVDELEKAGNLEQRRQLVSEAQKILLQQDVAIVPIYHSPIRAMTQSYLHGFKYNADVTMDFNKLSITASEL